MKFRFNAQYLTDGAIKNASVLDNRDFSVNITENNHLIKITLTPKKTISFKKFELISDYNFKDEERIFTNGYQSWTLSREYTPNDSMDEFSPRVMGIEKRKINPLGIWGAGDLTFHKYPEEAGVFYGYSYAYIRAGKELMLLGSLNERTGYTILTFNTNQNTISIEKDLQGVEYSESCCLLSLAVLKGRYNEVFDEYFNMMQIPNPRVTRKCGYTTWYNYYTGVTEDIVNRDLKAIAKLDTKIDIFQIDDGYERTVGDWLITDSKKFPNGMKTIADSIHEKNMLAGLWLAPFAATPKSYIYKQHKDWFVKNSKGKITFASHNWGGFYALDIYNPEVRAYIKNVFDTVLNVWGYDMVKLDFLYACCIHPIHGKSRGEIMCDAMDFLRECCKDKIILGCGVPLAPAFGKVDFCRIGCDVALSWDQKPFSREDVSTQSTLTSTIFRRHLDSRAWLNDPDVILLRDNNIKLTLPQREIIAKINSLCGNLLFVSDDVSTYTEKQKKIFIDTITSEKAIINHAEFINKDCIRIEYTINNTDNSFTFNLKTGTAV